MTEVEWRRSRQTEYAPRCRCNAIAEVYYVSRAPLAPNRFEVRCSNCAKIGPEAMSTAGAVSRWVKERDGVKEVARGPHRKMNARHVLPPNDRGA